MIYGIQGQHAPSWQGVTWFNLPSEQSSLDVKDLPRQGYLLVLLSVMVSGVSRSWLSFAGRYDRNFQG